MKLQLKRLNHSKTFSSNFLKAKLQSFPKSTQKDSTKKIKNLLKKFDEEGIKKKHLYVAHKINLKLNENNFFKKGIKDIFTNEKNYFSEKYLNSTIKLGNYDKRYSSPQSNTLSDKINITKMKSNNISYIKNLYNKNKLNDSYINSIFNKINNKKHFNTFIKRPSIYYSNINNITDAELKIIFQKYKIIEENNKKSRNKSDIYFNENEINKRISLQEQILNEYKNHKKMSENLSIKLQKRANKLCEEDVLINQIDNYRYFLQKINKKISHNDNHNKFIAWLSSLRKYQKEKDVKNLDDINNKNNKSDKVINKKEDILTNYINKYQYSFGNKSELYLDLESNITPLYPLILSQNLRNNEIIENTHIDDIKSLKKNKSISYFNNLNIEGKNLLNCEIDITKKLEGKKKYLIKNNYNDDEIKPLIFSKFNKIQYNKIPKAITNTINLHI